MTMTAGTAVPPSSPRCRCTACTSCSPAGVAVRVAQRLLALTAAIWHNRLNDQPVTRSLIAYDH